MSVRSELTSTRPGRIGDVGVMLMRPSWMPCLVLLAGVFHASVANSSDLVTGTWNVELRGEVESSCIAEIKREGDAVSGTLVCREAGLKLPIDATIGADGKIRPDSGELGWVVVPDGKGASGTYQSSLGAGSWTAVREQ